MDFDSLDEKTAFKLGFAQRCFELGFEPAQVKEALEKRARFGLGRILPYLTAAGRYLPTGRTVRNWGMGLGVGGGGLLHGIGATGLLNATKDFAGYGLGLSGGAGLLGGGLLGYAKAKLDEEEVDEDEIKSKELADTYKAYADRLRAQKAYQQYRHARSA